MPLNETVDDQDISVLYSGPWQFYRGPTNVYNASQWYGGTFASCGGDSQLSPLGPPCELRFPFRGSVCLAFAPHSYWVVLIPPTLQNLRGAVRRLVGVSWRLLVPARIKDRRPERTGGTLVVVRRRKPVVVALSA